MRGYGKSQKAYEKAKKDYKKKTGFSTVDEKMRSKGYTPPKNKDKDNKILKDLDEAQKKKDNQKKAEDKSTLNVGSGTGGGMQTTDFIDDLKEAYKAGLFTGGTKTKAFMDKYNLDASDIVKLRVGIDQGLGTVISSSDRSKIGGNVLSDLVGDLRAEGILRTSGPGAEFLQQRASEIYEPGMKRSNIFLPYDDPQNIFQKGANLATRFNPAVNILSGIFGSGPAMRGTYYGREVLGLEGEDLNNFSAAVANDRNLYNQLMSTPEMQDYQLNEFRAEANRNMVARKSDPDPISGEQGGGEGDDGSDDGTTDPGSDPDYTPPPQNYYTFFDPNLGRYRSGTYDEYLRYVTAKDGGIIQLDQGGNSDDIVANNKATKAEIADLIAAMQEVKDLKTDPSTKQEEVKPMLMSGISDKIDELLRDIKDDPTTVGSPEDPVRMAEEDQPARGILNIEVPSDSGPALREDLGLMGKIKDSGMSLLMEALRKSDISTGSANQFIEEALNNFVAAGIIPPNTSYDQLTDPFKDLVTREAAMIANSMATRQKISMDSKAPNEYMYENPVYKMIEGQPEQFEQMPPVIRGAPPRSNVDPRMFNVADGGIINLKDGGMNDMMQADSLMFRDPSDEGQWEYNV